MEPRITAGHSYLCKKSVVDRNNNKTIYYTKGQIYKCEMASPYFPEDPKYTCGYITNNFGNKAHAWPYDPQNNPLCHDSWTEFFEEVRTV